MSSNNNTTTATSNGSWNSTSNNSPNKTAIENKQRAFKQQKFHVQCKGMKPNTLHKFYYEGVERGQDCVPHHPKPITGGNVAPGSPLITDEKGHIEFHFYFTIDIEKQVDAENKVKYELAGDKKFELRAENSSAYKIVPYIDHHKYKNK